MLLSAQSLFERAVSAGNAGRYAATQRLLDLALARVGDDTNLRARILGTLVYAIAESGDLVRAAAMCKTALEIPGLTSTTRAVVIGQRGSIELRRGEHNQAVRSFSVAIGALINEPVLLATTQLNRGVAFLQLGRAREAGADFDKAATSFTEAGLLRRSARARHNQGYAALLSGNLITALALMDEARANAGAGSLVDAAVCNTDRAEVLLALGLPLEAVDALTAAARVYGARRLRWLQAGAEWSLANTLIHIDPHRARRVARQASIRYRGYGNEVGVLRADLLALQAEVAAGGPAPSPQLFALAQVLRERGLRNEATVAEATAVRADLHAKRTDAAAQSLRRIRVSSGAPILTRTLVREVRAEVASARGDKARALAHARRGLEELHEWQSTFGALDLQSSLNMHAQTLTRTGVTAALATGRAARVFEWSERARLNASQLGSPRAPDDERLATALTELRQLRVEGELTGARAKRDAHLREEVRRQRWKAGGSASTAQIASIHDVQQQLGAHDAVMVLYVWSGHELTALIACGDYSRLIKLGPLIYTTKFAAGLQADLDMHARGLGGALGASIAGALAARLNTLAEHLVHPVLADPMLTSRPHARLVLTVPGVLAGLPWSMLPGFVGRVITIPTSASRWLAQQRASEGADAAAPCSAGFIAGPSVPRAAEEVARSASAWQHSSVLTGSSASSTAAAALAGKVSVLHLATHGRHAAENPFFSGVELADGPWFGYDIEQLERVPALVVLSACEVGRSSVSWGQESLGMTRTWLQAGADCVIASATNVNDDVASDLFPAVHRLLADGIPASVALATATQTTGHSTPFVAHGSGW